MEWKNVVYEMAANLYRPQYVNGYSGSNEVFEVSVSNDDISVCKRNSFE